MSGVVRSGPSAISFSVSEAGTAATAPTPARARATTASIVPRLTKGRAASCTNTTTASTERASSPARTESIRCAPPATRESRSPRILDSHSGGRSAYPGGRATITCRTSGWLVNGRNARNSIGTPRMGRNCFGSPGPARTPAPAATTTTPTSGGEAAGEVTNALQADYFEIFAAFRPTGQEHAPKPLARGLGEPPVDARHGPNLTA